MKANKIIFNFNAEHEFEGNELLDEPKVVGEMQVHHVDVDGQRAILSFIL